jgi:hypothetical protein
MSDTQDQVQAVEVEQEQVIESQETAVNQSPEDDIFDDIFGDNSGDFAFQTGESNNVATNETAEVQTSTDPKEDANQFQYWQSQADKKTVEVETLKSQMSEMMKAIQSPKTAEVNTASKETVIERPVKPIKPANFDHSEAIADPDSKSAKYLAKSTEYMEEMTDYTLSLEEQRIESIRKMEVQTKKQAQEAQLVSDLQRNYGYDQASANDFLVKMTAPESMSLDNLVKLHKINQAPDASNQTITQVNDAALQKQANMMQQKSKLSIPRPIGIKAGVNMQSSKKSEDKMMDSMIGSFNKKNPF